MATGADGSQPADGSPSADGSTHPFPSSPSSARPDGSSVSDGLGQADGSPGADGGSSAPHSTDHGASIFSHPSTSRPTASLSAAINAIAPKPIAAPGQAVKAAAAKLQPRQRGRVGGLKQPGPVER